MNEVKKPWPCLICMVLTEWVDENHSKCPICKTEIWYEYDLDEPDRDELTEFMQGNIVQNRRTNPEFSILNGPPAKGGGGGSKGRSNRKQLMQKPSTSELFRRLDKQSPIKKKVGRPKKINIDKQIAPSV